MLIIIFFILDPLYFFLFFSLIPPSETIRSGVTKGPKTDPKGKHKTNPQKLRNWENDTFLSHRAGILLCMRIIIVLQWFFTTFVLLEFFYLSSLCLVFLILFLCLIALFDCFSFFSLYCILIFLLSLHPCSNNTQLLICYFLFWLSKSYISCHIIVVVIVVILLFQYYCK